MINFPVIKSLEIRNYELYPSSFDKPIIVKFDSGPNLIVGVNGSGKTTFISMCLRCITGPYDLPSATSESVLGNVRPKAIILSKRNRQIFAHRVADGAKEAIAILEIGFGEQTLIISRSLSDLKLKNLSVDGHTIDLVSKETNAVEDRVYHDTVSKAFGVGTFFDVLIILRFLVFMMEDRRALVWDQTAQRQIFRVLVLPSDRAKEYAEAQQAVISADSALRNTNQMITRHRNQKTKAAQQAKQIVSAEGERRVKIAEADAIREKLELATQQRIDADNERKSLRLARLKAAESRDSSLRELERIKIETLKHWLGPSQDTLRYILAHLLAEGKCLICEADPSPVAGEIEERVRQGLCPVCGTKHLANEPVVAMGEVDRTRIARLEDEIRLASEQIAESDMKLETTQERFTEVEGEYNSLEVRRLTVDRELIAILRKIPTERAAVGSADEYIGSLDRIADEDRQNLKKAEQRFQSVVSEAVQNVQNIQDRIAEEFSHYLSLFLKEEAGLIYQTVSAKVGQGGGGAFFEFPAFRLSMTGGAIAGKTVRDQPDAVSQSQAEFVDLAFRMALMSVVSNQNGASLVVDAPEASLDFLFAQRAGKQLATFSNANLKNRVIITSYLPSKHLVTAFLEDIKTPAERSDRIVDLIQLAADNAAMRADRPKYEEFLTQVINNVNNNDG